MSKSVETDLVLNGNELKQVSYEKLAVDPVSPYSGQYWLNTTSNKVKFFDGVVVHILADENYIETLIQQIGQSQGAFDASSGLLPTASNLIDGDTTIRRGDYWDISVAGTIAGIGGADELAIGDVLKFVGTSPTNPAHYIGIQRNINDTMIGNVKAETQTVNLVANTPLTVSAATISTISAFVVFNSDGEEIILDIKRGLSPNQRIIQAKRSLTGVVVDITGSN